MRFIHVFVLVHISQGLLAEISVFSEIAYAFASQTVASRSLP